MSCNLHLEHGLQQLNVLSHVGFLLQMYICHLADACRAAELDKLKQKKLSLEAMQREAVERYHESGPPSRTMPGSECADKPGKKASVSFTCGVDEDCGGLLPICKLETGALEQAGTDVSSPGENSPSDASDSPPSETRARSDSGLGKQTPSRQSFVIPRMSRPRARSRSKAFSVSPESHIRHFRDWGFPPFPQEGDASDSN